MHIIMITINNMWEKARHCAISVLIWFGSPTFLLRISSQKPTVTRDAQWYLSLEIRLYIRNWREWDEVWFWLDVNGGLNHLPIELRRRSGLAAAGIFGKLSSKLLWYQDRACSPLHTKFPSSLMTSILSSSRWQKYPKMLYLRVDFDDILSPQGRHKTSAFLAVYFIVVVVVGWGGLPKLINRKHLWKWMLTQCFSFIK